MNIEEQEITYQQLKEGFNLGNDPYAIGAFCLKSGVRGTLLSNPYVENENDTVIILGRVDGEILGREFYFPTKVRFNGNVESSLGASSLFVHEKGREVSMGGRLMMYPITGKKSKYLLYAGISKMAEPLYHKLLKFEWFSIPCKWQPRNSKFLFQSFGFKGILLCVFTWITNIFLKSLVVLSKCVASKTVQQYHVERLKTVPQWVEDIVLADTHNYMELHDRKWFEWILHNNFGNSKYDNQNLYGVFKSNNPVGFFLLKERSVNIPEKGIDNVVFGTMVEWGTINDTVLSEYQINKLALHCYSKNVDIVQAITDNESLLKRIAKYLFFSHGSANIAFRDLTKSLDKEYKNIRNWRIRVGYSDVSFY